LSFVNGPPPKVIWVRLGNCSTRQVEELLKLREPEIRAFLADPEAAIILLS
jgi:predicted nuclease of predicted toxin-antitoxin system